jgi:hypothetical protein
MTTRRLCRTVPGDNLVPGVTAGLVRHNALGLAVGQIRQR